MLQVTPRLVDRSTWNDVSVMELSCQVRIAVRAVPEPPSVLVRPLGAIGGSTRDTGRIMSISSWLRMWQW